MNKVLLFLIFCSLFAEKELEVSLQTETELTSIFFEMPSDDYLKKLFSVLKNDIDLSGTLQITPKKNAKLVGKLEGNAKTLFLTLQKKRYFKPLAFELAKDRSSVHELFAKMQRDLGQESIADKKILYTVRKEKGESSISEIWLSDYDGENARQITFENSYCVHPIFVPGAKDRYLYVSYRKGQPKFFLGFFGKKESLPVLPLKGNQLLPAISLKADQLAFISDAAGRPDLFIKKFGTQSPPVQLFSKPRATEASPSFSPDGKKVAFVSDKDGSPRIYLLPVEGKDEPKLLTFKNRFNITPSFSPDGTMLAYAAKNEGIFQIWIYDFATKTEWQLTKGKENKENPYFAGDSLHIVYNSEDASGSELYLIDLNQKKEVKISKGQGKKRFPSWEL